MNRIELHLASELQKESPNLSMVENLQKVLSNNVITFDEWKSISYAYTRDQFLLDNPEEKLRDDCYIVLVFIGGYYLQELESEKFFINDDIPTIDSIHIAQYELWDLCMHELWKSE